MRAGAGEGETHPEVDTYRRTALVLWEPLLVRKAQEQTALPDGRVPDEEELDVDGCGCLVLILCVRHGVCWRGLGGARCESCRVVKCTGSRPQNEYVQMWMRVWYQRVLLEDAIDSERGMTEG